MRCPSFASRLPPFYFDVLSCAKLKVIIIIAGSIEAFKINVCLDGNVFFICVNDKLQESDFDVPRLEHNFNTYVVCHTYACHISTDLHNVATL